MHIKINIVLITPPYFLYLTGGISNPFSILMIVPAIVSSTFLSMGTTIILIILTILLLLFGAKRLPGLAKSLGKSTKEFKSALEEE